MKIGEKVRHISRPDCEIGSVIDIDSDGTLTVEFANGTFSGITRDSVVSVEHELLQAKRHGLRRHVSELLLGGNLEIAEEIYERDCSAWWRRDEYIKTKELACQKLEKRRAMEEAQRIEREHESLQAEVIQLFADGRVIDADAMYHRSCYVWWDKAVYEERKRREERIRSFLNIYRNDTLCKLDEYFRTETDFGLRLEEYVELKKPRLKRMLAQAGQSLDEEQVAACARPERRLQIRARAGSGKTRTLCAKASLAIHDENLESNQVLILAFNKSAAMEITKRMQKDFGCPSFQNARTFHSLAYQLAKPKKQLLFDEGRQPSKRAQTVFVQRLLERLFKANPAVKTMLYEFFRKEMDEVERIGRDLSPTDYKLFRRSLEQISLAGERVRSTGEKYIADFLFEHGIPYKYEQIWDWREIIPGQPYRPDFSMITNGHQYILEHWAINPDDQDAKLPDDWDLTAAEYRKQIYRKRDFWERKDIPLLETTSQQIRGDREGFETHLRITLETAGIRCQRLPDSEIIRRVFEKDFHISRMAEQFLQFIQRAKKRCLSAEDVEKLIAQKAQPGERLALFHQLALLMYREYQSELIAKNAIDFDDLLRMATDEVERQGASASIYLGDDTSIQIGELSWLLVDEYQDFSELYYRMLTQILNANPSIRLLAVGDDWQAINGFAGAELRFFQDFDKYFPGAGESTITTNYRSARAIVEWGNQLMHGLGVRARPMGNALSGEARIVDINEIWVEFRNDAQFSVEREKDKGFFPPLYGRPPSMQEKRLARVLKVATALYHQTGSRKLLLVSRTKLAYGFELDDIRRRLVDIIARQTGEDLEAIKPRIRVMTAHTSKGQEEDAVLVLDATENNFPKVHPDNLLYEIFGVTAGEILAEERRLFYVAITRPAERLWILTDAESTSTYVTQLKNGAEIEEDSSGSNRRTAGNSHSDTYQRISALIETISAKVNRTSYSRLR